jgi:glucans biosynthesis protein
MEVRVLMRWQWLGGAPGSGAPRGNKNALKLGRYTREAIEERRRLRALLRQSRMLIQQIE